MHQLTYFLFSKVLFYVVYCLYSQYRVLSTACVLSYSAQEHQHYTLSTRQSWEKYFSVSQTPEWKLLFIFDRKKILNRIWQEAAANINIYSDWDLWYLQHGQRQDKTVSLGRNEKSYFKIGSTLACRESYESSRHSFMICNLCGMGNEEVATPENIMLWVVTMNCGQGDTQDLQ